MLSMCFHSRMTAMAPSGHRTRSEAVVRGANEGLHPALENGRSHALPGALFENGRPVQGTTQPSESKVRRRSKKWLAKSRNVFGRSGAATASASADLYLERSCAESRLLRIRFVNKMAL